MVRALSTSAAAEPGSCIRVITSPLDQIGRCRRPAGWCRRSWRPLPGSYPKARWRWPADARRCARPARPWPACAVRPAYGPYGSSASPSCAHVRIGSLRPWTQTFAPLGIAGRQHESIIWLDGISRKARIFAVASIVSERCQREHSCRCDAEQHWVTDFHRCRTQQRCTGNCSWPRCGAPWPIAFATLALDTVETFDPERDSPRGVWIIETRH